MKTNLIENKRIAIIGGGPGGLTLARILQMRGANVTVYERDINKDSRMQGATLDLHDDSGLKAIREAGLMDEFLINYRSGADRLRIMDKDANIILEDDINKDGELSRPEIDRGPLQKILLESLNPGTVVWNSHFVSLSEENGSWRLEFKNGDSIMADFVIGADGANSKVRKYITPIKPFYAGITAIEGAVFDSEIASPKIHKLLNGGKIFAMGDSKSLIVSSKGDGSLMFYAGLKTSENWSKECGIDFSNKEQVVAWFKKEYEGWDNVWEELFENASYAFIPRPQYCMPLDQEWKSIPNITMIGDAAHLMPPYAGEGVNMAMLDALELGNCLTSNDFENTYSAISFFEKQMLNRASYTTADTLTSTDELHSENAISFIMNVIS